MAELRELSVSPIGDPAPPTAITAPVPAAGDGEAELVARATRGDAAAFGELFRRHRSDVARLVQRLLGRSSDLEDVVQEVFLQIHRSLKDFRHQSRFSTWIYRVTVNVVLMNRRATRSRPVLVGAADLAARVATEDRWRPDELAARNARLAAYRRLLERLSEKKRTVYVLHELHGMGAADVASTLGVPVITVRTRLFYARRELAKMLRDEPALAALADELSGDSGADDEGGAS